MAFTFRALDLESLPKKHGCGGLFGSFAFIVINPFKFPRRQLLFRRLKSNFHPHNLTKKETRQI